MYVYAYMRHLYWKYIWHTWRVIVADMHIKYLSLEFKYKHYAVNDRTRQYLHLNHSLHNAWYIWHYAKSWYGFISPKYPLTLQIRYFVPQKHWSFYRTNLGHVKHWIFFRNYKNNVNVIRQIGIFCCFVYKESTAHSNGNWSILHNKGQLNNKRGWTT